MLKRIVNGVSVPMPKEEADALWAQWAEEEVAWLAEQPLKEVLEKRRIDYGPTEDQLDMQYWDKVNGTTTWKAHVADVKAKHPKP
jgi:hypothetical protein